MTSAVEMQNCRLVVGWGLKFIVLMNWYSFRNTCCNLLVDGVVVVDAVVDVDVAVELGVLTPPPKIFIPGAKLGIFIVA